MTAERMSMRRSQSAATVQRFSMETFQSLLEKKLSAALANAGLPAVAGELTQATDPRFGDYQTNAALVLGKQAGENPRVIAQRICDQWGVSDLCGPPQIAGPGFLNFTLQPAAVEKKAAELFVDDRLGVAKSESP